MNTRIRYSKQTDGSLVSMRIIKSENGMEYRSYINPDGVSGKVHEIDTATFYDVKATSPHKVKIALKNTLIKLGCVFKDEERGANVE